MAEARHTPDQDTSFRRSLVRNVAGGVGLIVLVAAIFGVLGMFGRADLDDLAAGGAPEDDGVTGVGADDADPSGDRDAPDGADSTDGSDPPDGVDSTDDADSTDGPEGSDPDADAPESEQPESPDAGSDEPGDPAADAGDPDGDDPPTEAEEEEPAADEEPPPSRIDPATISVQVLDGYRSDGGAAADAVATELRDAGYRIVATNPALAYEVTTVLWSPGFEAEGRQIAAEIGAAAVQEQPGNLSNDVNVHVVVGADRG